MEDIKKAIEEEYLEYLHGTTDEKEFLNNNDLLPFKDAVKACEITASFILSKWEESTRWRKVEEGGKELDNQDIVLVRTNLGCVATAYYHGKESGFIVYGDEAYTRFGEIIEWKPIH